MTLFDHISIPTLVSLAIIAATVWLSGLLAWATPSDTQPATFLHSYDGDSPWIKLANGRKIKLRFKGADTPEMDQPYGLEARDWLRKVMTTGGLRVKLTSKVGKAAYQRTEAIVWVNGQCINNLLIAKGLAWADPRYATTLQVKLMEAVRKKRIGLWSQPNPVPPWEAPSRVKRKHKKPAGLLAFFTKKWGIF
jgi:micrococcal nuclease